jgi:histidinol-phosphatase (PHP family)
LPISVDLHIHTSHSHGLASTEDMYLAARDKGLVGVGFSDHSPRPGGYSYPSDYQERLKAGFADYVREVGRMARRGEKEGVTVLLGLEVDYLPGREEFADKLRRSHPFDYLIGGLHFQGTWGFDYSANDWSRLSREQKFSVYARYYDDLAAMCRSGLFHIAAHPDLVKIFSIDSFNSWLETDEALARITNALTAMKDNGVIMEISSAGLRKPCKEIYPGPKIMALAAALGLAVSFASDAHCPKTPAFAFGELARYASGFGYTHSQVVVQGAAQATPFAVAP